MVIKISLQLEESNKILTKDVENLRKEKTDLNEKLLSQDEGTIPSLTFMCIAVLKIHCRTSSFFFHDRVCSSEGRDYKCHQSHI